MKRADPRRYAVMIRRTATGYSVDVPDVPGCVAVAKTVKGARRLIAEALTLHLELMRQSGEVLPVPRRSIKFAVDDSSDEEFCTWVEVKVPEPVSAQS
jgi:predicted RNase H-like HicB family nuclease